MSISRSTTALVGLNLALLGACQEGPALEGAPVGGAHSGGGSGGGTSSSGGASGGVTSTSGGRAEPGSGGGISSGGRAPESGGAAGSGSEPGSGGAALSSGGTQGVGGSESWGAPKQEPLAPLPLERQEHAVVALRGEVYVLGGYAPNVTPSVMAYDPKTDKWRDIADFPSPFNHPNAVVVDDKIYVAGFYAGTSLTGPATGDTYVYDPDEAAWQKKKSLPDGTARAGSCVTALGSDIYIFGGGTDAEPSDFVSVYHTAEDSWEELPSLPEAREHCSAFAVDGKLIIAGGRTHTIPEFRPTTLEFDPATEEYTQKAPIPTPRGGAAGAVLFGRLFLLGGEGADNQLGVFSEVEAYDPSSNSWEAFPALDEPRHGYGAAVIDSRIYLAGGATREGGSASSIVTVYYFEP